MQVFLSHSRSSWNGCYVKDIFQQTKTKTAEICETNYEKISTATVCILVHMQSVSTSGTTPFQERCFPAIIPDINIMEFAAGTCFFCSESKSLFSANHLNWLAQQRYGNNQCVNHHLKCAHSACTALPCVKRGEVKSKALKHFNTQEALECLCAQQKEKVSHNPGKREAVWSIEAHMYKAVFV